jgi:hypothetical protein
MFRHARSMLTFGAAVCLAVPLSAQQGAPAGTDVVPTAAITESTLPAAGPTLAGETVGVRFATATEAAPLVLQDGRAGRNVTWMIVGGAALVVGSLVGGDAGTIIMVTGAVIGLVGLFRYLR